MNIFLPLAAVGAIAVLSLKSDSASAPSVSDGDGTPFDYSGGDAFSDTPSSIANLFPDETMDASKQIYAFLAVIRNGESSNNYGAYVGGGSFSDFSHHPALPPTNWKGVGNSHACGAYQFQPGTWSECAKALNLVDFSPMAQDAAATFLLKRRGAYDAIVAGNIAAACDLLKPEWQMFQQSRWSASNVAALFESYGGVQA